MSSRNRMTDRVVILALILLTSPASSSAIWAESSRIVSVPALAVSVIGGQQVGNIHYVALQLERDPQGRGPTILFSESLPGSAVDDVWKDGARAAIAAAARVMKEDERNWRLTIKNRSRYSLSGGSSASSAIAVGIIAAWRGDTI
ncbi:MAG: hypothetical protein HY444_05995, partial [Nitrospirae bacterium]|nr:hypothetical protein [Nitrospirota bacterium]